MKKSFKYTLSKQTTLGIGQSEILIEYETRDIKHFGLTLCLMCLCCGAVICNFMRVHVDCGSARRHLIILYYIYVTKEIHFKN